VSVIIKPFFSKGKFILFVFFLGFFSGCSTYEVKSGADSGFNAKVQDIIFKRCITCHSGGRAEGKLGIIDQPLLLYKSGYIIPGDPEGSSLYRILAGTLDGKYRMPYGGPYLNDTQLADIADWIRGFQGIPKYKVSVVTSRVTTKSTKLLEIFEGDTVSVSFIVEEEAIIDESSTGDCPKGSFNQQKNTYTTGPISGNCEIKLKALKNFIVTPSKGENVILTPSERQSVVEGSSLAFKVGVESGYNINKKVGGDCPEGIWKDDIYTTGEIKSDCAVSFTRLGQVSVTLSGNHVTLTPSNSKFLNTGSSFTVEVVASPGYGLSQTVGGTCPAGTWSGNSYTIASVNESCILTFSTSALYTVSVNSSPFDVTGVGTYPLGQETLSLTPTKAMLQKVSASAAADPTYTISTTVGGTCPTGSWSGGTYTTGTITSSCTVQFTVDNPCSAPLQTTISFASDIVPILTNSPTPNAANKSCMGCHTGTTNKAAFSPTGVSQPSWTVMTDRSTSTTINGLIKGNFGGINNATTGGYLIVPHDPLNSWLYRKVSSSWLGDARMPKNGTGYLSASETSKICHWIWQGALNN
jgi:hypothetical protein